MIDPKIIDPNACTYNYQLSMIGIVVTRSGCQSFVITFGIYNYL